MRLRRPLPRPPRRGEERGDAVKARQTKRILISRNGERREGTTHTEESRCLNVGLAENCYIWREQTLLVVIKEGDPQRMWPKTGNERKEIRS